MKKILFATLVAIFTLTSCTMEENPLLVESTNPYGAPAFDKIQFKHYKPAFEKAVAMAREEVDAIINNTEEPTFENTVEALERAGSVLTNVEGIFFNLVECCTSEQMQALAEEISPLLTEYSMYVSLNPVLFSKVKAVYDKRGELDLNNEQMRLLTESYRGFVENGANLSDEQKAEFSKYAEELSIANLQFNKNVLAATNAFSLNLTDEKDLEGLPDYVKEMGAEEAKLKGQEGWAFTLDEASLSPFLTFSARRDLREKMWRAYNTRCIGGENDTDELIHKIVDLRTKEANILGYPTYADYALHDRMAKNQETVNKFISDLMEKSLPFAKADVAAIADFAAENGFEDELMPWDFSYWNEKYKNERYSLSQEMLKPYFELHNVLGAVLGLATKLYGLSFTERDDIPVYQEDVICYEVKDGDRFMGLVYFDFFPRDNKSGGAWMTSFREASVKNNVEIRPLVSIVTNFTKPTSNTPSLLTFDEVTTILHEFGHGLHGLLAEGSYESLTGTNVTRDFVELPSQIMENWAYEPEYLQSFAKHYQTGEVIPQEYIDRIIAAKNHNAGYAQVRQLQYGTIDMAWHSSPTVPMANDVDFEHEVFAASAVMPVIEGTAMGPAFTHIFSGGYAAGYYSYKWAEVLDADAFSLFKENGIFSAEVAKSFRENILSKGNLEDADVLFRNFRGRDPRPEALLERSGMISSR